MRQNDADLDHHTAVNLNYRNKLFSLRETVELVYCSNYLPRKQNCTGIESLGGFYYTYVRGSFDK